MGERKYISNVTGRKKYRNSRDEKSTSGLLWLLMKMYCNF
jgi:hypothetical protein